MPADDRFMDKANLAKRSISPTTNAAMRHAQAHARSESPRPGWQTDSARSSGGRLHSPPPPGDRFAEDGTYLDLQHAYRRLNDEALAHSGGILETLPEKKGVLDAAGEHVKAASGETVTKDGGVRLQVDTIVDSSEEESPDEDSSSDGGDGGRGRPRKQRARGRGAHDEGDIVKKIERSLVGIDSGGGGKKGTSMLNPSRRNTPKSLLAAAEEERTYPTESTLIPLSL